MTKQQLTKVPQWAWYVLVGIAIVVAIVPLIIRSISAPPPPPAADQPQQQTHWLFSMEPGKPVYVTDVTGPALFRIKHIKKDLWGFQTDPVTCEIKKVLIRAKLDGFSGWIFEGSDVGPMCGSAARSLQLEAVQPSTIVEIWKVR